MDREDFTHKRHILRCLPTAVDHAPMIRGIAAREQGILPRINQRVYCLDMQENAAFYMYDDRGCLIYSGDENLRKALQAKRPDWIVPSQ